LGDANAQFMYGLAHLEDWTGLYDPKRACYWIRESAVKGLSQARLALANKAVYDKQCFDAPPTLDEAKIWAQLAAMSIDRAVKENAEKLLQEIVRFQITNQRQAN
jgi:TPR repeat protein